MNVAAFTGFSGSGKTTLIRRLIEQFVAEGKRVGAIKHTHHPLNEEDRGDTSRFRAAGANPVILAGAGEAVIFDRDGTRRVRYEKPHDLLAHFDTDVVLVEGFRSAAKCGGGRPRPPSRQPRTAAATPWPIIELSADARPTLEEARANLDRIWRP